MTTTHPPPDSDIDPDTTGAESATGTDHHIDPDTSKPAAPAAGAESATGTDHNGSDRSTTRPDVDASGVAVRMPVRVRLSGPMASVSLRHALLATAAAAAVAVTAHQVGNFVINGPQLPHSRVLPDPMPAEPASCVMFCTPPKPPPPGECVLCDPASPGSTRMAQWLGAALRAAGGQ